MRLKVFFQLVLITIIFVILIAFYYTFFNQKNEQAKDIFQNDLKKDDILIDDRTNKLTNIEYNSIDSYGNSYYLNAKKALVNLNDEKKYEVKLEGITSIINLRDKGIVYINSNNATYNKKNHDTFFYGNVKISYLNNSIISENLDLVFSKKISKVYNNVVYNSDQLNLITDKILIDMVSGDIKFRMIDKNNKIKFKTKHEFIN